MERFTRDRQSFCLAVLGFAAIAAALVLALPTTAEAFNENVPVGNSGCGGVCHSIEAPMFNEENCAGCHTFAPDNTNFPPGGDGNTLPDFPLLGEFSQSGPHGIYKTTTNRCAMCHTLHAAPTGFKLLPGNTVKATCFTCHDGTGGYGVYGTIEKRTGSPAPGGHRIDTTNEVPGGDASTGGSSTAITFRGTSPTDTLTCSDCHSPHDSNTVQAFTGERLRMRADQGPIYSTKLLKKQPTGASEPVDYYGSDWCASCHRGRTSGGTVHNHPVETKATRPADFYYYNRLAVLAVPAGLWGAYETGNTVALTGANVSVGAVGTLMVTGPGGSHPITQSPVWIEADFHTSPWLMTYPRAGAQIGHAPICQQCHEDLRDCGDLSADGATANVVPERVWGQEADGVEMNASFASNPRFQNFPHETEDPTMLVESGDDLCLNCHPTAKLP